MERTVKEKKIQKNMRMSSNGKRWNFRMARSGARPNSASSSFPFERLPRYSEASSCQKPVSTSLERTLNRVINSLTIEWWDNITTAYFTSITWNMISSGDSNFSSLEFSADFFVAPPLSRVDIKAAERNGMSSPLRRRRSFLLSHTVSL